MWVKAAGEITEHTIQINTAVSSHFLVHGDSVALVDAGIWCVREELWESIEREAETIEFILLTHAHFDHVGAIPYLREKAPHLRLVAGRETAELLKREEVLKSLLEKNKKASDAIGETCDLSFEVWTEALKVDMELSDGEVIRLGDGVEVKLIESPGHTSDSVSYYVKPDFAICAGEALGQYGGRDIVSPSFNQSYDAYIASIEKLSSFDVQLISFPHGGSISGEMVGRYITDLIRESGKQRNNFIQRLESGELVEEITGSIASEWAAEGRYPDGPFTDSLKESVQMMIKASRSNDS
jgi:glyoxylase-like metal-dependent hydrolase (beta-lactamase superfamily II)